MSVPQSIKDSLLWTKAIEITDSIRKFAEGIPNSELGIYDINKKLKDSVEEIPHYIEDGFREKSQYRRDRNVFLTEISIEECRNYLNQANVMRLGEAEELIASLDNFKEMLNREQALV